MTRTNDPLGHAPLLVHEIGSLAKPSWRVKPFKDLALTDADVQAAQDWATKLEIQDEAKPLLSLIATKRDGFTDPEKELIIEQASRFAIRLQEHAGLAWVYDGEQHRSEMYHYPVTHSEGFEFRGHCRSFDNKYWNKAAVVDQPSVNEPFHVDEFETISQLAEAPVKVPITGAYTLIDWSFDEHYLNKHIHDAGIELGSPESREARAAARQEFVVDVARHIVRPNIEALIQAGAKWIQIDEPAVATHPEELALFVESFNESVQGLTDQARFSTHICFSDYTRLFPDILELDHCAAYSLELSNRDPNTPGTNAEDRPGYRILDHFADHDAPGAIGLGVVDIHTDELEPTDVVADRIRYALDVFDGDATRVWPCTDCGLRTRSWEVSYDKFQALAQGTQPVRQELEF